MAQLGNLLVKGSSRFLNKAYFEDVSICGDVSIGGKLDITANEGKSILSLKGKKALEAYDEWLNINESKDFSVGVYCGTGILRIDGAFQVGNGGNSFEVINNTSLTSHVPSTFSAQATFNGGLIASSANISEEICNTLIVKDELRSAKWNIDNITNLGSTFYVSPCIVFTNPSVYVNSISGTTVVLTITDNSITSSTIGGAIWTNGSKVKLMGRIGNSALGTINGVLKRDLNSSTAKTAYISLDFPNMDLIKFSAGATYSGSDVGDLKMMMYEVNKNVNGTAKNRPIGILLSSYGENKKPCIDIYNGDIEDGSPVARMGYLNGLPSVNGVSPTGYGFYAAGNAYFSGTLVSSSGKIGGFSLSENSIQNGSWAQSGGVLICTGTDSYASIGGSDSINGWCFTAGNTFGVTKTGELYATSGKIGGCSISNGVLSITNATSRYASFEGNGKTNICFHIATLKIVSSYVNCAMVIGAQSRGYGYSEVNIQFGSQQGTNPNLDFFNQTGRGDWYIKKTATSTWDVYCRKYENWGWTDVVKYIKNSGVEITWGTGNADLPSDSIRATQLAGSSAWCYNNDSTYIDGGNIYAGTVTADKITTNNISGTNGWINLRSGLFDYGNGKLKWDGTSLSIAGNGKFAGEITATSGKIGKYTIDDYLSTGSGSTCTGMGGNQAFWAGSDSSNDAPFHVSYDGSLYASKGKIAGWDITSDSFYKDTDNYTVYVRPGINDSKDFLTIHDKNKSSGDEWPFYVHADGWMHCVYGDIGGWTISGSSIYKNSGWKSSSPGSAYFGDHGLSITDKFSVDKNGVLMASDSILSGNVYLSDGSKNIGRFDTGTYNGIKGAALVSLIDGGYSALGNYNSSDNTVYIAAYAKNKKFYVPSDFYVSNLVANDGTIYVSSQMFVSKPIDTNNNTYIFTRTKENYKVSLIGWSVSNNIWIGDYGYGGVRTPASNAFITANNVYKTTSGGNTSLSDERYKHGFKDIPDAFDFIMNLNPCLFKFDDGTSDRYHMGFKAQEVENNMLNTIGDTGLTVKYNFEEGLDVDLDNPDTYILGLRYEEFIAPLIQVVQNQQKQIQDLEKKIAILSN